MLSRRQPDRPAQAGDRDAVDVPLTPVRVALWYAVIGSGWIVGSDAWLATLGSPAEAVDISRAKGLGFVAVTTVVLYLLLRRRERELAANARELRRLGELARAVLDSVHFPVAVVDGRGEIVDTNRAWRHFALENGGDLSRSNVGVNYLEVCEQAVKHDPDVGETVARGVRRVLEGRAEAFHHEYPCHSPNQERWFRMEVSPIQGVGAVIVHWDTTPEYRARHALEELVRAKDDFFASVSHELRTPLTAVVGYAELLNSAEAGEAERAAYRETLVGQAREVADLVEDLLLVGRLDSSTVTVRPESLRVAGLVGAVVKPWTHAAGVDLSVHSDDPDIEALADPLRSRQILRNLVSNAIQHGRPPVRVEVRQDGGQVEIAVVDAGPGIPEGAIETMYEQYATGEPRLGQPGSVGLGLYLSRSLAEMMGGELTYERRGDETVFALRLPVHRSPVDERV